MVGIASAIRRVGTSAARSASKKKPSKLNIPIVKSKPSAMSQSDVNVGKSVVGRANTVAKKFDSESAQRSGGVNSTDRLRARKKKR